MTFFPREPAVEDLSGRQSIPVSHLERTRTQGRSRRADELVRQAVLDPDPARFRSINRLKALGLAYSPNLTNRQATVVATQLYDASRLDPSVGQLWDDEFERAVTMTDRDIVAGKLRSPQKDIWDEATSMLFEISARSARQEREARVSEELRNAWLSGAGDVEGRALDLLGRTHIARWTAESLKDLMRSEGAATVFTLGMRSLPLAGLIAPSGSPQERTEQELVSARQSIADQMRAEIHPEFLVAGIARELVASGDVQTLAAGVDVGEAYFATLSQEEQDELVRNVRDLTTEELVAEFEEDLSTTPPIQRELGRQLEAAFEFFNTWDAVAQVTGIAFTEAVAGLAGEETPGQDEGFEMFTNAWQAAKEEGLGGYWGLEGAWADWVNLGSSLVFDPANWLFPGGVALSKNAARHLATEAGTDLILNQRNFRSAIRQIAKSNDPLLVAEMSSGMPSDVVRTLLTSSDERVIRESIRQGMRNGFYLGEGPGRVVRRYSALGAANVGRRLGDEGVDQTAVKLLTRQSSSRSYTLGENEYLDEATDFLVMRHSDDPDKLREAMLSLRANFDDYTGGAKEVRAAMTRRVQELRDTRPQVSPEVKRVPELRQNIRQAEARLREMDTELAQLSARQEAGEDIGTELAQRTEEFERLSTRLDSAREAGQMLGPQYDEWFQAKRELDAELTRLGKMEYKLNRPRNRDQLAAWLADQYDEWGRELGLVEHPTRRNPYTGRKMLDWSPITGHKRPVYGDDVDRLAPLADDPEHLDELRALGLGDRLTRYIAPVSPWELLTYKGAKESGKTAAYAKVAGQAVKEKLVWASGMANRIFAANVLLNPVTGLKASVDETVRFGIDIGGVSGFARSTAAGTPAIGRVASKGMRYQENPWARAHAREMVNPLRRAEMDWQLVDRSVHGRKAHFEAAERYVNGFLVNDDAFRAFAQGEQGWAQWWDQLGQKERESIALKFSDAGNIEAQLVDVSYAREAMERSLDTFLGTVDEARRPAVREALLTAARRGERVPDAILRQVGPVPGEVLEPSKLSAVDRWVFQGGFDTFFGAPSQRRGGVFFDEYFEWAKDIYTRRFEGRVLTPEFLVSKGYAANVDEAMAYIAGRNEVVDDVLRRYGLVTEDIIEAQAARYAARRSEDLMYQVGASSALGKGVQAFDPFAPARFDFMRWWGRELMRGTSVRTPAGIREIPGMPLNLRLLSRFRSVVTSHKEEGDPSLASPVGFLQRFTFLPVNVLDGGDFLQDFTLSPGPLASWLLHLPVVPDGVYETLEGLMPSLGYVDQTSGVNDLFEYVVPKSGRSVRGMAGSAARMAFGQAGAEPPQWLGFLDLTRRPLGMNDLFKSRLGEMILEEPELLAGPNLDAFEQRVAELEREAASEANRAEGWRRLQSALVGFGSPVGSDYSYVEHYRGLVEFLPHLQESDLVGQAEVDQLTSLWRKIQSGDSTRDERQLFADQAADILFSDDLGLVQDMMIVAHPSLAINMVSGTQAVLGRNGLPILPADSGITVRPDGTIRTPPGRQGADLRLEAYRQGWVEPRDEIDVARDVAYRIAQARRKVASELWKGVTGKNWHGSNIAKEDEGRQFSFNDLTRNYLELLGIANDGSMSGQELADALDDARETWPQQPGFINNKDNDFWKQMASHPDTKPIADEFDEARAAAREAGFDSEFDWPEEQKAVARGMLQEAITLNPLLDPSDYAEQVATYFGQLDYEPPQPPPVGELENSFDIPPQNVQATDGDTIRFTTRNGEIRARIIGINAPEQGQEGYVEATENLEEVLRNAERLTIGTYLPELFGTVQDVDLDSKRLIVWLYVDGEPLWNPESFTSTNPTGIDRGGNVEDLRRLLTPEGAT